MSTFRKETMYGQWKHSFEEDNAEEIVYRPESFPLQRSRGRKEIQITENGKFIDTGPGSTDIPEPLQGDWHLEDECLIINYNDGHSAQFDIKEVSPEKLVIKRT
jgi:hypothetical protein